MPREYTKVKHLEPVVFQLKQAGKTNAQIGAQLGLTKAQIKGLIKRHNRRLKGEIPEEDALLERELPPELIFPEEDFREEPSAPAGRSGIRTHEEVDDEILRLAQEVESLEEAIREIDRLWSRVEKMKN